VSPELTCREAARLLFGQFDRTLTQVELADLEAHIAECEACVRVRRQAGLMRRALDGWRAYREDAGSPT
jgi:hypothetical protein